MFKRTLLAAVAISMLAAPMAQAQSRHDGPRHDRHHVQPPKPSYQNPHSRHHAQPPAPKRHHWKKGERFSNWRRHQEVRDHRRHGLRAPARGQQWVKVDNDYILISVATGLILGLAAGR